MNGEREAVELMPVQISLIDQEDIDAVLFEPAVIEKRYTAKQAHELERLREAVFMLLPAWPVDDIARRLGMSTRTVRALAAQFAEKVAGSTAEFKQVLRNTQTRWLALARTREHEATYKELVFAFKLVADALKDLELTGAVGEEKVINEDRDRAAAATELRSLMELGTAGQQRVLGAHSTTDSASSAVVRDCEGLRALAAHGAAGGAGHGAGVTSEVETGAGQAAGVGGDARPIPIPSEPMGSNDRDLPAKADRSPDSDLPAKGDA